VARTHFYISMKNAMAVPLVANETIAAVPADPAAPEVRPPIQTIPPQQGPVPMPRRRTLRAMLFGRISDYARRYITASVEHRLSLVQERLDSLSAQGNRIEHITHKLLETVERTQAQSDSLSRSLETYQLWAQEQIGIVKAQNERLESTEARGVHLEQIAQGLRLSLDSIQMQMAEKFGALAGRSDSLQVLTQGLFALENSTQAQMLDRFSGLNAQTKDLEVLARGLIRNSEDTQTIIGRVGTSLSEAAESIRGLPSLLGPRFDELEIKIRPLVAFDEESYAIRLRDGYAMVPRNEPVFAVMVANATSEGLEPGTRRVLQSLIEPGMGVADVGANVGLLTLACAVATGPGGRVYAFEPEAGPRNQLQKTRHLNGLSWVDVHDLAVGAQSGVQTFHVSPIIGHSSLYALPAEDGVGKDIEVQVRRLDDVIGSGKRLDVVKIDVEGAELDVLAGMQRLLNENPDLAIVAEYGPSHLERIGIKPKEWFQAFKDAGFEAYTIAEPSGACRKVSQKDLKHIVSINIAFVRPQGAARLRLPQ